MSRILAGLALTTLVVIIEVKADQVPQPNQVQYTQGQIVRVDPATGTVVVRSGTGDAAKEAAFQTNKSTKYWGTDRQPFDNGLRYKGFAPGTDIWYAPGTGDNARYFSEVHFYNPTLPARK